MKAIERLALFDLDDTLIDASYQITDDAVYGAVREAQDAGWTVGLNSDTPYEALRVWRERFGMNGPIVAERGAVVELDGKAVLDESDEAAVADARRRVADYAVDQGIVLWQGNPVEALRSGLNCGEPGQTVMLLNMLSQCSLRFFVRTVEPDGSLAVTDARTQQVIAGCRPLFPAFTLPSEDNNAALGLLIAARGDITKRQGTQHLLSSLGLARCVMVGNSIGDYLGDDIAEHFAVGNATPEYRMLARTVSEPVTSGSAAVLRLLARQFPESNSSKIKPDGIE